MRNINLAILAVAPVLILVIGVVIPDGNSYTPPPPTCIEARGPAIDPAEHAWSAGCVSASMDASPIKCKRLSLMHCIESACIAFRGKP